MEATLYFVVILVNIKELRCINVNMKIFDILNKPGLAIVICNLKSINQEATLNINLVEPA